MTTIEIKHGLKPDKLVFDNVMEAMEMLSEEMDFVLLSPISDELIRAEVIQYKKDNHDKPLSSFNYL